MLGQFSTSKKSRVGQKKILKFGIWYIELRRVGSRMPQPSDKEISLHADSNLYVFDFIKQNF
jgi:hypothetical protein